MLITITVVSILVLSAIAWFLNRVLRFTICPICAGIFLTWVGLVIAHLAGYQIDLVVPALLMGGSVVGVTYQLEKKFRDSSGGAPLFWKALFIPAGFVVAYAVLEQLPILFLLATGFLFLVSFVFLPPRGRASPNEETVSTLEKKVEDCC